MTERWVRITYQIPMRATSAVLRVGTIGLFEGACGVDGNSQIRFEAADLGYSVPDWDDEHDRFVRLYIPNYAFETHAGALPGHWKPWPPENVYDYDEDEED